MDPLYKKAIAQGVAGMAVFVAFIFLPAGTWHYWQGWLFIAVFSVSTIGFTVYLALYDRPLLERRMNAGPHHDKEWSRKNHRVALHPHFFYLYHSASPRLPR